MNTTGAPQMRASQNYAIPFAIVIAGLAIAGAIYFGDGKKSAVAAQPAGAVDPVTSSDHILGNPNAKVVIVEYSDTECPFCNACEPPCTRHARAPDVRLTSPSWLEQSRADPSVTEILRELWLQIRPMKRWRNSPR